MNIYQVAEANRDALLKRDEEALRALVGYYQSARATAEAELRAFQLKIAQAKERGETVGPSWLFQERRLSGLLERIGKELDGWAGDAARLLSFSQRSAIQSARSDAGGLLRAALGGASELRGGARGPGGVGVEVGFNRLPSDAFLDMVGFVSDGSPLVESFLGRLGEAKRGALKEIKNALTTGVALGKSPAVTARRIRSAMGGPLFVAMRYTRTETIRAYRTATLREYRGNADLVEMWEWSASLSRRTCPVCLALHGERFPLSEPFGSHPNCRCSALPVLKPLSAIVPGAEDAPDLPSQSGEEFLRSLPERDQVAILGKEKAQRWREGSLPLRNLVGYHVSDKWGPGRSERSLKEALTGEAPGAFPRPLIPAPRPASAPDPVAAVLAKLERAKEWERKLRDRIFDHDDALEAEQKSLLSAYPVVSDRPADVAERLTKIATRREAIERAAWDINDRIRERRHAVFYAPDAVGPLTIKKARQGDVLRDAKKAAKFVGRVMARNLGFATTDVSVVALAPRSRAYESGGELHLAPFGGDWVAVHEMGHWAEAFSPTVKRAAFEFYERRTQGAKLERLKDLVRDGSYNPGEVVKRGGFPRLYTGRWYGDPNGKTGQYSTEIVAIGLEELYTDPEKFYREDPDHFAFMVRLLAGDADAGKKEYRPEGGAQP